jgi:hypothetical protein
MSSKRLTFVEAIAREEGFFNTASRPHRNNNPGDLEYGRFTRAHGATGTDGRFAIFKDAEAGFKAMSALLRGAYVGLTVAEALNKWAPPIENQTNSYIKNVCFWTGLSADTVLTAEMLV